MVKTLVAVPSYKNEDQVAKCKMALADQTASLDVSVYEDTSSAGFTQNSNKLLRDGLFANYQYVVLLNQDCYLKPTAVEKMVEFMDAHPKCAIAGIKQLMASDPDKIIHGGTTECYPQGIHITGTVKNGDCTKDRQVPWVNGACMIFRVLDLLTVGLMDENMKMFGSDADISYRARAAGKECWYIASAECLHEWGVSKGMDDKMNKQFQMDMLYFRDKWLNGELYKDLNQEYFKG